jgi:hypothetical protein
MKWYYKILIVATWVAMAFILDERALLYALVGIVMVHMFQCFDMREKNFDTHEKIFETLRELISLRLKEMEDEAKK